MKVSGEMPPVSFHKICVNMEVNKIKFERNSFLEYDLHWENKTYKLKRCIELAFLRYDLGIF